MDWLEDDSERQVRQIGSWTLIGFGLFFAIFSFGLLYFGLGGLARALDIGYTSLPAIGMLVSWVGVFVIAVLMLRFGWRTRRNLKERD